MSDPRAATPSGDDADAPFDPLGFDAESADADGEAPDGRSSSPDPSTAALDLAKGADSAAAAAAAAAATVEAPALDARDVPGRDPVVPGHVSIAPRVLQRVGGAVVAEQLAVDRTDVRVDATDDEGKLALHVSTPVVVPPLTAVPADQQGVVATLRVLQDVVTRRMAEITGRAVSRVDISVTRSVLPPVPRSRVAPRSRSLR